MDPRFEQFIREKKYLCNVTPQTEHWYRYSLVWLTTPDPDEAALKDCIIRMREHGLKPTSCNCHARAINSYLRWAGSPLKIQKLKEPQLVLPTFGQSDIQAIMKWKAKGFWQHRVQVLILTLADTGCRIAEALGLRWVDVDFDNLLVTLHGKGARDRIIPFSLELRRRLWRWKQVNARWDIVFPTREGQWLHQRNTLRSVKSVCTELGIKIPARTQHAFRHTFAVNYVRQGGSVFHLQKMLGHSTLDMSRHYANLSTADLSAVHEKVSLLTKG